MTKEDKKKGLKKKKRSAETESDDKSWIIHHQIKIVGLSPYKYCINIGMAKEDTARILLEKVEQ